MAHRRVAIAGVVMAVAVWAMGCGHSGSQAESTRSPSMTPSASPRPSINDIAKRDAVAAYRGMWDAWVEAGKTSDPDAPALRTYTSGDALKLIVSVLATNQHHKKVARGDIVIDPKAVGLKPADSPTEVIINDCVNDENWLMHKSSGGLVNDVPGGRHSMTATVARVDGSWKVTEFKLGRVGTC